MIYYHYLDLLPSFLVEQLNHDLVKDYFNRLPAKSVLTADILSDNVGFDEKQPFGNNQLLNVTQNLINSNTLNKDTLSVIFDVFDHIDFKFALIFLVQLRESFSAELLREYILSIEDSNSVFNQRLNIFLSVFVPEILCIDNHDR